jgi:endoglycosylceramidase
MSCLLCVTCISLVIISILIITILWRFFSSPEKNKNKYFTDNFGRLTFHRGVNVCNYSKWAYNNLPWHTREDYLKLKYHGFNLVRFLVFWEAIEPVKDAYDRAYIEKVRDHIRILNELGISVIIDIHQDLYNRKFTGNGFPDWALPEKNYPFKPQKNWFMNYFQKAVKESYKHFWRNEDLKKKYVRLLGFIEYQFKNEPNVIGIDVMNEPFPVLPFIFNFEKGTLANFYRYITYECKDKEYTLPFFFEPGIWTSTGIPTYLLDTLKTTKNIIIPHYYPPFCHQKGNFNWFNKWLMTMSIKLKASEAQKACSPYIIGEFGMSVGVKNRIEGIKHFMELADRYHLSWTWWSFDKDEHSAQGLLDSIGNPNEVMKALTHAYPQKIAGSNPIFYNKGNKFYLEYTSDVDYGAPTEIYVPGKMLYITSDMTYTEKPGGIFEFDSFKIGKHTIEIIWQSM